MLEQGCGPRCARLLLVMSRNCERLVHRAILGLEPVPGTAAHPKETREAMPPCLSGQLQRQSAFHEQCAEKSYV